MELTLERAKELNATMVQDAPEWYHGFEDIEFYEEV